MVKSTELSDSALIESVFRQCSLLEGAMQQTQTLRGLLVSTCATRRTSNILFVIDVRHHPSAPAGRDNIDKDYAREGTREVGLLNGYRWPMAYLIIIFFHPFIPNNLMFHQDTLNLTYQHEIVTCEYVALIIAIISHCGP